MGSGNAYMWHACMCQCHTLITMQLLIGSYVYNSCIVVVTCNYNATCQKIIVMTFFILHFKIREFFANFNKFSRILKCKMKNVITRQKIKCGWLRLYVWCVHYIIKVYHLQLSWNYSTTFNFWCNILFINWWYFHVLL